MLVRCLRRVVRLKWSATALFSPLGTLKAYAVSFRLGNIKENIFEVLYYSSIFADMKLLDNYISQLKEFEGLRLRAYKPSGESPSAMYTIGYGHYGIKDANKVITEDEADTLLFDDLKRVEDNVRMLLMSEGLSLSSSRYTALVDFMYNVGYGRFVKSSLWRSVKERRGDDVIRYWFRRYVYSGKTRLRGLELRREYCVRLWMLNTDRV